MKLFQGSIYIFVVDSVSIRVGFKFNFDAFLVSRYKGVNPKVCNKKSGYNDYSIGPSYSFEVVFNRRVDVSNLLCWRE